MILKKGQFESQIFIYNLTVCDDNMQPPKLSKFFFLL